MSARATMAALFGLFACNGGEKGLGSPDETGSGEIETGTATDTGTATAPDTSGPCEGTTPRWYTDADGDGWGDVATERCERQAGDVAVGGDCDDADPARSPDADERCDGVDDDCDGEVDEHAADGFSLWRDLDGDGYGDPELEITACEARDGYIDNNIDCWDLDASVSPEGFERCDAEDRDEDCDGLVDDEDDDATGQERWYADADTDGHGDGSDEVLACEAPAGRVSLADDCDDANDAVHPLAEERCDEADNDCDGALDEDPVDGDLWYLDVDLDGFGTELYGTGVTARACVQPEGYAAVDGDCDDTDPAVNPDAAEIWYDGLDSDCDEASDNDADGDGYDALDWGGDDCDDTDPAVHPDATDTPYDGLDADCGGGSDYDADGDGHLAEDWGGDDCDDDDVLTWPGSTTKGYEDDLDCDGVVDLSGTRWEGTRSAYPTGSSVSPAGDTDGDGLPDLAIGVPYSGSTDGGDVYVVLGPASGGGDLDDTDATIDGEDIALGWTVDSAGDVDGDGYDELIMASLRSFSDSDELYMVRGPLAASTTAAEAEAWISSDVPGLDPGAIAAIAGVGDMDGDTLPDLAIGSPWDDSSRYYDVGAVWIVGGALDGEGTDDDVLSVISHFDPNYRLGMDVADAGDLDGDGSADLVAGAPRFELDGYPSQTWAIPGPVSGSCSVDDVGTMIEAEDSTGIFGTAVAGGADMNGDGYDDLLIGEPEQTVDDADMAGTACIFLGPVPEGASIGGCEARLSAGEEDGYFGADVAWAGDVDGDGVPDALIGSPDTRGARSHGGAWIFPGPLSGSVGLDAATLEIMGPDDDRVGDAVAGPGDLDGDGYDEVLVGAPYSGDYGMAILVRGGF